MVELPAKWCHAEQSEASLKRGLWQAMVIGIPYFGRAETG